MHVIAGSTALRILRALRCPGCYEGFVPLPNPSLSVRRVVLSDQIKPFSRPFADLSASSRLPGECADHESTLADEGFSPECALAARRLDFARFHGLGDFSQEKKLELGVFDASKRIHIKTAKTCLLSLKLPAGSLISIDHDLYVICPELVVIQIAGRSDVDAIDLAQIIMELCGTYSLYPSLEKEARSCSCSYGLQPVMAIATLRKYMQQTRLTKKGRQTLSAALCLVCEGSASPAETGLALMLSRAVDCGGYGFGSPLCNARLDFPDDMTEYASCGHYTIDLFWQDCLAGIEYESATFHFDPLAGLPREGLTWGQVDAWRASFIRKAELDRRRLREIQATGVQILPVVGSDLANLSALDRVAWALAYRQEDWCGVAASDHFSLLDRRRTRLMREVLRRRLFVW